MGKPKISISDDLMISIGDVSVKLSAREGLRLSEKLARAGFRCLLQEEAEEFHRKQGLASKALKGGRPKGRSQ